MVSFSQLQAVPKKKNIFGAARKKFGPYYFVTALTIFGVPLKKFHNQICIGLDEENSIQNKTRKEGQTIESFQPTKKMMS